MQVEDLPMSADQSESEHKRLEYDADSSRRRWLTRSSDDTLAITSHLNPLSVAKPSILNRCNCNGLITSSHWLSDQGQCNISNRSLNWLCWPCGVLPQGNFRPYLHIRDSGVHYHKLLKSESPVRPVPCSEVLSVWPCTFKWGNWSNWFMALHCHITNSDYYGGHESVAPHPTSRPTTMLLIYFPGRNKDLRRFGLRQLTPSILPSRPDEATNVDPQFCYYQQSYPSTSCTSDTNPLQFHNPCDPNYNRYLSSIVR